MEKIRYSKHLEEFNKLKNLLPNEARKIVGDLVDHAEEAKSKICELCDSGVITGDQQAIAMDLIDIAGMI